MEKQTTPPSCEQQLQKPHWLDSVLSQLESGKEVYLVMNATAINKSDLQPEPDTKS
ncbi:hypothetical protein KC960_03395 [Candidatus Saccharibacteria bacterium]|nr:hypothetical protein [Candidatus Saccharibacteria bacterium]